MAHHYLSQTWTGTPAGDLTDRVGNEVLARIFDDGAAGYNGTAGDAAIDDAEMDADSILGPSFTVPTGTTSTAPRIVKRCVADIAIFYGYDRFPEFASAAGTNPQQARYDRAIKILKDIKRGERDMGDEAKDSSANSGGVSYATEIDDRFILDDMTDGPF
jgi:phage gp36-like protein